MKVNGIIGVQMMMLKEKVAELGAYEVLRWLSEMGFHAVEVSQIPMTPENVAELQRGKKDFGIKIAALSAALEPENPDSPGEFLTTGFDKITADCRTLGCKMLRIGMLPVSCMASLENAIAFARRMDEMSERLQELGIGLYYHNHHVEFTKYDGKYLLDILRESTKHIGFELDVHWIQRGGENPVSCIERFCGRIQLIHLKDYRIARFTPPENPSEFQQAFSGIIEFAEIGEGNLPMKEIINTAWNCGSRYFLIEQDQTYGRDPFDALAISKNHLVRLGYGDWFQAREFDTN